MTPLLVLAEFRCSEDGDAELRKQLERTLEEVRAIEGCLQATVWERSLERRYLFTTIWSDSDAVRRWVENEFHRTILMPGFRHWCTEGSFSEFTLETDHDRARKCAACGRWTRGRPGWSEQGPTACRHCGRELEQPVPRSRRRFMSGGTRA
jgi:quinol monooxygenase YgiN